MLDKAHVHQINKMATKQKQEIKELVLDITHDIKYSFKKKGISNHFKTKRTLSKRNFRFLPNKLNH